MTDAPAGGWVMAWAGDGDEALVEVTASGAAAIAVAQHAGSLATDEVASRIAARHSGLWGPLTQAAATRHLGWTELHVATRTILPELATLRAELTAARIDRVVVAPCAPAAEIIASTAGVGLIACDPADPSRLRAALAGDLARTVVVLGACDPADGSSVTAAFTAAGLDPARHIVVVPDRGSELERTARASGYHVFAADPNVTGPFGALSARAVVPAALAGADVSALLDEAAAVADILAEDAESNPALVLAAAIAGISPPRSSLAVVDAGSGAVGLADWVTRLVAESTGPRPASETGTGVLEVRLVALVDEVDDAPAQAPTGDEVTVAGSLGAQFLLWQYAAVVAALMLGVNPFQPDTP